MSEEEKEEKVVYIKANKPLFMEYFGYDADKNREKLSNKIKTRRL